jgi:outer membrane protein TolC
MKALKLSLLPCLLYSSLAFADENDFDLDKYISKYKQEEFNYDYQKSEAESSKLRDSWIAPVRINYSYSRSNPYVGEQINQNAAIRIDQPIFQSGGIYYGIKFAKASKLYNDYSIDVAKKKMIKETVATLMQIKQLVLKEQKQKLQIKNSDINLLQKKEEYLSGQLDSGFLDNAIIQRNIVKSALYDIETSKAKLISKFESLSDLDYKNLSIPHLKLISDDEFLKNNIVLKQRKSEVQKTRYAQNVRIAKYLPSINFTAGYNWNKNENRTLGQGFRLPDDEISYYDYGIKLSLPIDINTFRDVESARVDYLKSKVLQKDKERELNALYEQVIQNIENFDKKIELSKENIVLYSKLLDDTKELFKAGYKTQYDVDTLKNSLEIQKLDKKIYDIDKQLELLNLYEMYVNSGE